MSDLKHHLRKFYDSPNLPPFILIIFFITSTNLFDAKERRIYEPVFHFIVTLKAIIGCSSREITVQVQLPQLNESETTVKILAYVFVADFNVFGIHNGSNITESYNMMNCGSITTYLFIYVLCVMYFISQCKQKWFFFQ